MRIGVPLNAPCLLQNNSADRCGANTKPNPELLIRQHPTQRPNLVDLSPCQFGPVASVNIENVRDWLQMVWIHTRADAAKMVQLHTFRNRAKPLNPIHTMGAVRSRTIQRSVPVSVRTPLPNPAAGFVAASLDEIGNRRKVVLVTKEIAKRLSFNDLEAKSCRDSKGRGLATTTQTKTRRIRVWQGLPGAFMSLFQEQSIASTAPCRRVVFQALATINAGGGRTLSIRNIAARLAASSIPSLDFSATIKASSARLSAHRLVLSIGVMPRSVCALPGSFVAVSIP